MNKIIIVGHPQSGYQEVEALLNVCGMNSARPSRREGFTPEEIGATLCKAHKTQPLHLLDADQSIQQIETSPVWHGMVLDLMLGNIDQELWGWADPQSVYLLDYWKTLDPKITFILVYNDPHTLLTANSDQPEYLSQNALQQRAHIWQAYNAALLHFYYRNPERCLLVHAKQVRQSANRYLQQVQSRIDAPLIEANQLLTASEAQTSPALDQDGLCSESSTSLAQAPYTPDNAPPASATDIPPAAQYQPHDTAQPIDQGALKHYLAEAIINQQPRVLQLYEELQSVANLPLTTSPYLSISPLQAWRGMTKLNTVAHELAAQAQKQQVEAQQQISQVQAEKQILSIQLHTANSQSKEQQQENDLLLVQLHQVQEDLERHYLQSQQLAREAKAAAENQGAELQKQVEQLKQEKTKAALATQLNAAEAQANKELQKKNDLLQVQLRQAQDDLERHSLQRQQLAREAKAVAENQVAELQKQVEQLKQEKTKAALATQRNADQAHAIKELQQENDLLLAQLHQVQEELERCYLENQALKVKAAHTTVKSVPKPAYYSAADRIKRQLSYRLGATMIERSRSFSGVLTMPWALVREARQFKRDKPQREAQKLPPIAHYSDAHQAERVKQHLSYRLGTTLLANAGSPIGWVKLPWALSREVKNFRRRKQASLLT